jgi:hypothetical protein
MKSGYENNIGNQTERWRRIGSAAVAGEPVGRLADHYSSRRRGSTVFLALIIAILVAVFGIGPSMGTARQQATPGTAVGHPLVGTWVIDPEIENPTNPPSFNAFMADGTLVNIGSDGASVGTWEATGPSTATMTFSGLVQGESGVYFIIRGNLEVEEAGETLAAAHSFTLVSADGTVLMAAEGGGAQGTRIHAEPLEAVGQPPPQFPTWTPATPEVATPTS